MERGPLLRLLTGVLLCSVLSRATIPSCLNQPETSANAMKCWTWSYNNVTNCTLVFTTILDLFQGVGYGLDFIFQPGYFQGTYSNNLICTWDIVPKSACHKTSFGLVDKQFHQSGTNFGQNCHIKDHLEVVHSTNTVVESKKYCGFNEDENCPVSNCPSSYSYLISDNQTTVIFKSDEQDTATGFLAFVTNDVEIAGCSRKKKRAVQRMKVPVTKPQCLRARSMASREVPCECFGTCTLNRFSRDETVQKQNVLDTIRKLVWQPPSLAQENSYQYVNSEDPILRGAARRILENIKTFGVTVPTTEQKLQYAWQRLQNYDEIESIIKENPTTCLAAAEYMNKYEYTEQIQLQL